MNIFYRLLYILIWFLIYGPTTYCCYRVIGLLIDVKEGWGYRVVMIVACWIMTSMIIFIGDLDNLPPTLVFFLLAVYICCSGSRWQRLGVGMIVLAETFSFNALIDSYLMWGGYVPHIVRLVFWLCLWLMMKKRKMPGGRPLDKDTWKLITLLSLLPLGTVAAVILLQPMEIPWNGAHSTMNLVLLLLCVSSFGVLMQAIPVLAAREQLMERNRMYEMNRIYYENLERQQTEIRILRHDMANHLSALVGLSGEEMQEYVQELTGYLHGDRQVQFCAHPVVNGVLNAKMPSMEHLKISFTHQIVIPKDLAMEDVELCALVGNSLDNAIEACGRVEEERRFIQLTIKAEKGMFVLQAINAADENISFQGFSQGPGGGLAKTGLAKTGLENTGLEKTRLLGSSPAKTQSMKAKLPKTTKNASKGHGFGLRSIQEIVSRYDGKLELTASGGRCTLFLYLPVKESRL